GLDWEYALKDSIFSTLLLTLSLWAIFLVINSYPTKVGIVLYALVVSAFFSILSGYIEWQALRYFLGKDDEAYLQWLINTMPFRYLADFIICGWIGSCV